MDAKYEKGIRCLKQCWKEQGHTMVLLYDSAVRVSELTGLRINDLDFKTLSIHIHGKGNKERSVAISEKTAAHLKRYMSIYHADGTDG